MVRNISRILDVALAAETGPQFPYDGGSRAPWRDLLQAAVAREEDEQHVLVHA